MYEKYHRPLEHEIAKITWNGNSEEYDIGLRTLAPNDTHLIIFNPVLTQDEEQLIYWLDSVPDSDDKCLVLHHDGKWIAKLFPPFWEPHWNAYQEIEIEIPKYTWINNPTLDRLMKFDQDPRETFIPSPWDKDYELIWYLDKRVNPLDDNVWAIKVKPMGRNLKGIKHMGSVMPSIKISYNKYLPIINLDATEYYPPFWDLEYENVYYLDPKFSNDEKLWILKYTPLYKKNKGWRSVGYIEPKMLVQYNKKLSNLNYTIEYQVSWHDLAYEHVWLLDRKHMRDGEEDMWAFKITYTDKPVGTKIIDYVTPTPKIKYNKKLSNLNYTIEYQVSWHDLAYEHVWLLDRRHMNEGEEDMWAFKVTYTDKPVGTKIIDYVTPTPTIEYNDEISNLNYSKVTHDIRWHDLAYEHVWLLNDSLNKDVCVAKVKYIDNTKGIKYINIELEEKQFDVIFISYNEPNAEKNWKRVLKKAPRAKRINGVKGIFNAHKAAAQLATTDMFYVVDGDAYIVDDWEFNFKPSIFDRNCAYVWSSQNPINDLTYQNGGIKLFPKKELLKIKSWTTLDMFTGIFSKIKTEDKISCITAFNTDEFSTWRSAFRECVKLYCSNQIYKLNIWLTRGKNRKFGKFAIQGARDAEIFAKKNINNRNLLLKINDYTWLKNKFNKK